MKIVLEHYAAGEDIPVQRFIRNRKLVKYFNRESAAALVASVRLLGNSDFARDMPFYYETGIMEHENLGLDAIAAASVDAQGAFSQQAFAENGTKAVHPLTQFKALYNMPLSFVSIEHGLTGENAVIYASAQGLLQLALQAPVDSGILLGCGKVFHDGAVAAGFALVDKHEIANSPALPGEAIELFRHWQRGQP